MSAARLDTERPDTERPDTVATRAAYDTVAESYARLLQDNLAGSPYDRAMLDTFAELVDRAHPVADLGCGPGRITGYLAGLGLDVFGVDLSPAMVAVARATHPSLRFEVGSIETLDVRDESLGAIVAWYSIIHTPPSLLPAVFAEFRRVIAPGGHLLLAFQVGDGAVHPISQAYGHSIDLVAYRLPVADVTGMLTEAGFAVEAHLVREPIAPERTQQAYLIARAVADSE